MLPRAEAGPEEVELKLTVLDHAAIHALILDPSDSLPEVTPIGGARTVILADRYLDTADDGLWAVGLVARIRTERDRRRLTVKSLVRRGGGAVHRRLELEGDAGDDDEPQAWPPSAARARILQTIGTDPLWTLVTLGQRRLQRDVAIGVSVIELSLDEIEVARPDGRRTRWVELEAELRSGAEADLDDLEGLLRRRPDLVPATTSKLELALAAVGHAFTQR
ncbi:MAG: CYTH domain-containing protein [Chloroflexota bacterium]